MTKNLLQISLLGALSLLSSFCALTGPAYAHVSIVPAKAVIGPNQELQSVAYVQPCDATPLGIVFNKTTQNIIELGVALSTNPVACVSIPKIQSLPATSMLFPKSTKFASFIPTLRKTPIQFSRIDSLKYLDQPQAQKLQVVHHRSCRAVQNSLPVIKQEGTVLSVGIVEYRRNAFANSCVHTQNEFQLPVALGKSVKRLNTLQLQENVAEANEIPTYNLKLNPIEALASGQNKGLRVKFARACNEAPIGVFLRKTKKGSQEKYYIGALTAVFDKRPCATTKPAPTVLHIPHIYLPGSALVSIKNPRVASLKSLRLVKPQSTKVKRIGELGRADAQVNFFRDCDRHLGLIITADHRDDLAVGILKQQQSFTCNTPVSEQKINQPIVITKNGSKHRIYPLNLEGQTSI